MTVSDTHGDLAPLPAASPSATPAADAALRRRHWIEVGVVALVAVVPELASALMYWFDPLPYRSGIAADMVYLLSRSAGVSAVVLYLMWRSGEGWAAFGFPRPHLGVDGLLAAVLFVLGYALHWCYAASLGDSLWALDPSPMVDQIFAAPEGVFEWGLTVAAMVANGFAEEVVLWGFLFTRLRGLLGSPAVAVAAVSLAFGSYHIYQGIYGACGVVVIGLVHGAVFAVLPRLWPLIAAHAIWDLMAYAQL